VLGVEPAAPHAPAFDPSAYARLTLKGAPLGYLGIVAKDMQARFDLAGPVVASEVNVTTLIAAYPAKGRVTALPEFPGIERDVSLIVGEDVAWSRIAGAIEKRRTAPLEAFAFVTTYRGAQVGKGKKSVTIRLIYRDPARTLRHEEVDAPSTSLVEALKGELGAEVRA
jgi:phenylalanyl-tRNA synthetase beta chain